MSPGDKIFVSLVLFLWTSTIQQFWPVLPSADSLASLTFLLVSNRMVFLPATDKTFLQPAISLSKIINFPSINITPDTIAVFWMANVAVIASVTSLFKMHPVFVEFVRTKCQLLVPNTNFEWELNIGLSQKKNGPGTPLYLRVSSFLKDFLRSLHPTTILIARLSKVHFQIFFTGTRLWNLSSTFTFMYWSESFAWFRTGVCGRNGNGLAFVRRRLSRFGFGPKFHTFKSCHHDRRYVETVPITFQLLCFPVQTVFIWLWCVIRETISLFWKNNEIINIQVQTNFA